MLLQMESGPTASDSEAQHRSIEWQDPTGLYGLGSERATQRSGLGSPASTAHRLLRQETAYPGKERLDLGRSESLSKRRFGRPVEGCSAACLGPLIQHGRC